MESGDLGVLQEVDKGCDSGVMDDSLLRENGRRGSGD